MNCNYKVKIKDIQNKYQFKIFCKTYDDTEIQEDIDTLEDDVEALQEENLYLNSLVEQAFDKKEVEGEELSINDTIEAKMNVSLYGNTSQDGTPTPDSPVEIQSVTGNNKVVVSNKNLLNIEDRTYTNNGISAKVENGTFIINGTPSGSTSFLNFSNITLKAGTYTISANNTLKLTNESDFRITNSNGTTIFARLYLSSENAKLTFTLNEDLVNGNVQLRTGTSITYNNFVIKPQLEQGSTATSYVPYKETIYELDLGNIELCKIGDYQDYLYKENGKWYLNKQIGKVVLDGSENIVREQISNNHYKFYIQNISNVDYGDTNYIPKIMSDKLVAVGRTTMYLNTQGITSANGSLQIYTDDTKDMTVSEFRTWLGSNNIIAYYGITTPTDTKITDTTLISQLEALKTAMSYTEQTNISQINNDIPFILKVTALASYNSRIVALENAILNANRSTQTKNARKSNKIIEEPKKEVVDDNKDENIIKEEE